MDLIAHRGCADAYPENTLLAIERSSRRFPAVELDVRRCRSGELVVIHDETVDRVTDGGGAVADLRWTDLRELEVLGSGERIPLLSEALAHVPPGVNVQIELKETGLAADAVASVTDSGVDARFTSFLPEALADVRTTDLDAALGYLFDHGVGIEQGLETALELDCNYLHPHANVCMTTDVVEHAHSAGMDVIAWGVDDVATCEQLREIGIDGATAESWAFETSETVGSSEGKTATSGELEKQTVN